MQFIFFRFLWKNENKVDKMVDIMSSLQQYVPTKEATFTVAITEVGITEMEVHKILLGGDQLTAERARGTCRVQQNSQHPAGCLERTIPVPLWTGMPKCALWRYEMQLIIYMWSPSDDIIKN